MVAAVLVLACRELFLRFIIEQANTSDATGSLMGLSVAVGLVSGTLIAALMQNVNRTECRLLAVLISIAAGSIGIMFSRFSMDSLIPVAVYGIALINGLLIDPVCRLLTDGTNGHRGDHAAG